MVNSPSHCHAEYAYIALTRARIPCTIARQTIMTEGGDRMSDRFEDLPTEIQQRVFSFLRIDPDGNVEVVDAAGLVNFVVDNVQRYPALGELVKVDETALTKHIEETGHVPPGVKLVTKKAIEGQNVTKVRIYHGPATVPEAERD